MGETRMQNQRLEAEPDRLLSRMPPLRGAVLVPGGWLREQHGRSSRLSRGLRCMLSRTSQST
jgi:hypothetical protein